MLQGHGFLCFKLLRVLGGHMTEVDHATSSQKEHPKRHAKDEKDEVVHS
ncbi:hypothetical protein AIOL_002211 [Candidatus Rhodobacter oscarellae]|uniref:Uncharacterized protein n=1 Tax=Candidatus Rhodobacter oscarellae TaxID=1675527 RepID=A0A0J9E399_9RHOB|nr:hypothetical protein AIOL_002211 [Candidatus Rhodobacter lobularis]